MAERWLVTGATAGIGAEFASQLAARGADLVLVARDAGRLAASRESLRSRFGIRVETISADLTDADGIAAVEARLIAHDDPVTALLNNAGYGVVGEFDANPIESELHRLELMVTTPFRLMHVALGAMLERGGGTIVNVASVAGFTPRGSYGAEKAFLLSFSRWANLYYRRSGITVTAVAPGFVRTEFHDRAGLSTSSIPKLMWLEAPFVVRSALRSVARGRAVSVPSIRYKVIVALTRVLPDRIIAAGALAGRQATR